MRKRTFASILITLSLLISACSEHDNKDINGQAINFSTYQGKWIVINYWATWCKPCYEEIPQLNALYQANLDRVIVFGVNFDGMPAAEQRQFANQQHIKYPLLANDPAQQFGIGKVATLPASYVINPQGQLVEALFGPQTQHNLEAAMGFSPRRVRNIETSSAITFVTTGASQKGVIDG